MNFGATDIPTRGVDYFSEVLKGHEVKLANAKKQRETILLDIKRANAAVDMGDQRARLELNGLNKQNVAAGRLVLSFEAKVAESRKRLAMATNQVAVAAAKRASADEAALVRDKLFEVVCPDGRKVRHRHHSLEALRKALQPGYSVVGQVFGMNADDTGGFVSSPGAPSMVSPGPAHDRLNELVTARMKNEPNLSYAQAFTREYLHQDNRPLKSRVDAESVLHAQRLAPAPPFPAYTAPGHR
jgi:hypothetical protein